MQEKSIKPGSSVIIVDDLIATGRGSSYTHYLPKFLMRLDCTGGSAKAAGELVSAQGGKTLEYLFIIGLPFLKGSAKLDAPTYTMLDAED